ncbi:hypothetical protein [Gordoniibacillus kamchatkensis]|uniref:hypothetical protein n=1 Tax=Gordoniibacillus kamchatkensis TaxID=1590651 RepID=UPI000A885DA6|nr:hypothetical protein [Paenibacillus sp. VKM B-2647]
MKHIVAKQVAEEAGITEPQAELAVEAVIGYLKTRMPKETAEEVENLFLGANE